MTANEYRVLKVVERFTKVTKRKVASEMSITDEYAQYMLKRLAVGGYVAKEGRETYTLLRKGVEHIVEKLTLGKNRLEVLEVLADRAERLEKEIEELNRRKEQLV